MMFLSLQLAWRPLISSLASIMCYNLAIMTTPFVRQLTFDELIHPADHDRVLDAPFPEAFANTLAEAEAFNKHLFRPNTYLHKWWARRCGSTFRTILKQFVSDPSRRDYYAPGGLAGKIVLDPMMGGGTTLHEALRLGASVIGADVDPIPIVQARASLTQAPLHELRAAFDGFHHDLYRLIGSYFQTECPQCAQTVDSQFTLYGLRKQCACGDVVQVNHFDLRHEAGRVIRIWPETWAIGDAAQPPTGASVRCASSRRLTPTVWCAAKNTLNVSTCRFMHATHPSPSRATARSTGCSSGRPRKAI